MALGNARIVSIGPVTSAEARALGLEIDAEAERHDLDGLVDAIVADATANAPHRPDLSVDARGHAPTEDAP